MAKPLRHARVRRAFTKTLKEARRRTGISQEDLAYEARIDRAYVSALERGMNTPTIEMIFRLVVPLKMSASEFVAEMERNLNKR